MKTTAILLRSPRVFPLSVWATFKREIQIFTYKFTPLSRKERRTKGPNAAAPAKHAEDCFW